MFTCILFNYIWDNLLTSFRLGTCSRDCLFRLISKTLPLSTSWHLSSWVLYTRLFNNSNIFDIHESNLVQANITGKFQGQSYINLAVITDLRVVQDARITWRLVVTGKNYLHYGTDALINIRMMRRFWKEEFIRSYQAR